MGIGAQADDEGDELINADQRKQTLLERKDWRSRHTFRFELLSLTIVTGVFILLAVLIIRIMVYCNELRITLEPQAAELTALTMQMVQSTATTLNNVALTSSAAHKLSFSALPQLIVAVNSSVEMIERIEMLLAKPSFQLSLLPSAR